MVMDVDALCHRHGCYQTRDESTSHPADRAFVLNGFGHTTSYLCGHVTFSSSWPSELSASLVVPADKLARQRLWPVECKSSYDVPGVLGLRKQAFFLLAYEAFVNIRCHVDATSVSDVPLHLRPRKPRTRSATNAQKNGHLYPLYRGVLRLTLSCPSPRWPMSLF